MSVDNPGGKRWWRGGYVCECVTLIVPVMERRMIDAGVMDESFDFFQYGYNAGGVPASAGTHDQGGVWDSDQDSDKQLRIQRECGGAAWGRTTAQGFDPHNHTVLCGCPHLSAGAEDQENDYRNGRNGLANNGADDGPDVPYITWQDAYRKYEPEGLFGMTDLTKPHRSKDQTVTGDDEWQTLRIDDDDGFTFVTGPCDAYLIVACLALTGLDPGDVCQFRFQGVLDYPDDRDTVVEYAYPITELVATTGTTFDQVVWANNLGGDSDGAKRRLRLFCSPPLGRTVTITDITSRVFQE